jgi:hypothetical protein
MPTRSYQLVNPIIEGTFQNVYEAKNPITAADGMWNNLTEHIVSHVPRFVFTMKDISSGTHHHFEVTEREKTGKYTIKKLNNIDAGKKEFEELTTDVDAYNKACAQMGGESVKKVNRSNNSSSSSDSDSDSDKPYVPLIKTSPIAIFHYNPYIYYRRRNTILNPQAIAIRTPIFTPIFRPILRTYVGIWP